MNASVAPVNVRHKPELLNDNLVREINYFIMFLYYKWACREISPFSVINYSVRIKEMRVCQF